jgi:hypothetical protein
MARPPPTEPTSFSYPEDLQQTCVYYYTPFIKNVSTITRCPAALAPRPSPRPARRIYHTSPISGISGILHHFPAVPASPDRAAKRRFAHHNSLMTVNLEVNHLNDHDQQIQETETQNIIHISWLQVQKLHTSDGWK